MKFCALDISLTATGCAVAVNGKIIRSGVIPGRFTGVPRLIYVRNAVMEAVDEADPDLVVMEALSFGSKGSAVHDQAGLCKSIEMELVTDNRAYFTVAPMTLKKFVCGSAGSSKSPVRKEHMLKEILRRFGHDVTDNNIADALGLCYLAMATVGEWKPQIDPQRQVVATLLEKNPWLNKMMAAPPYLENPLTDNPEQDLFDQEDPNEGEVESSEELDPAVSVDDATIDGW